MVLERPLRYVLCLLEVPMVTSTKVSSPGLIVSFEPLDVCQQSHPQQWDHHALRMLSGFSYEGVDASVSRAFASADL